jgi:hypothetical protein
LAHLLAGQPNVTCSLLAERILKAAKRERTRPSQAAGRAITEGIEAGL